MTHFRGRYPNISPASMPPRCTSPEPNLTLADREVEYVRQTHACIVESILSCVHRRTPDTGRGLTTVSQIVCTSKVRITYGTFLLPSSKTNHFQTGLIPEKTTGLTSTIPAYFHHPPHQQWVSSTKQSPTPSNHGSSNNKCSSCTPPLPPHLTSPSNTTPAAPLLSPPTATSTSPPKAAAPSASPPQPPSGTWT